MSGVEYEGVIIMGGKMVGKTGIVAVALVLAVSLGCAGKGRDTS